MMSGKGKHSWIAMIKAENLKKGIFELRYFVKPKVHMLAYNLCLEQQSPTFSSQPIRLFFRWLIKGDAPFLSGLFITFFMLITLFVSSLAITFFLILLIAPFFKFPFTVFFISRLFAFGLLSHLKCYKFEKEYGMFFKLPNYFLNLFESKSLHIYRKL